MVTLAKKQLANNASHLLDAALAYATRGWSIIPTTSKRAAWAWRNFQTRPADELTLRRMFAKPGITGLAVILGSASGGLACRDWDVASAYHRWAEEHPEWAATLPTVQTPRGFHVYFAGPNGFQDLGDGEYRATFGHYCLLPPSLHPDGALYRWLTPLPKEDLPTLDPVEAGQLPQHKSVVDGIQARTQAHSTHSTHSTHSLHVSPCGIEAAILATLPSGPGQRNRRLFEFARQLKAIVPGATMDELEVIVRSWHARALPIIRTKDWLETWFDFRVARARVKRPLGTTMARIVAAARVQTPADADAIGKLVALCQALREHHGSARAWPLSCRMAASEIGTSHKTAAGLLKLLVVEGFIELVTCAGPRRSGRAAEYRYLGNPK